MQSDVSIQQIATHRPITRTSRHLACHRQRLRSHHSVLHRKCLLVSPSLAGTGKKNQTTVTVVSSVKGIKSLSVLDLMETLAAYLSKHLIPPNIPIRDRTTREFH